MNYIELEKIIKEEFTKRYPSISVTGDKVGEFQILKLNKGKVTYNLVLHPMLQYKFISFCNVLAECLVMADAVLEVENAI